MCPQASLQQVKNASRGNGDRSMQAGMFGHCWTAGVCHVIVSLSTCSLAVCHSLRANESAGEPYEGPLLSATARCSSEPCWAWLASPALHHRLIFTNILWDASRFINGVKGRKHTCAHNQTHTHREDMEAVFPEANWHICVLWPHVREKNWQMCV